MPTEHLTQRRIDALRPRVGQQYVVWDGSIPGFGVRVNPQGTKTFIFKYRLVSGRVRWKTLGRVGTLALAKASRMAKVHAGVVADGGDPLARKDAARDALTVSDVADQFLADHVAARRKPATLRLYRLAIERHLKPRLGTVPVADVSADDLLKLHHQLRATPYLANRVLAVTSKLLNWAALAGYRGDGPHVNPCLGLEKFREVSRRRYLAPEELKRLGAALRVGERHQRLPESAVAAIRLLLLTGARSSEILSLRWRDIDLKGSVLNLPDSKSGRKTILLSAPAIEILKARPRFEGSPYVFPGEGRGKRRGQHRVSLADPWAWLRRRAKVPDLRIHDLRHSYASVAASSGQSLPMIGALLGHTQAATTHRYAHLMTDPLRAASDATAATIAAGLDGKVR